MIPEAIARQPLLTHFAAHFVHGVPELAALNRAARGLVTGSGQPLRFVPPDGLDADYESRAFEHGEVVTRPGNWHDLFGALAWLGFPKSKAAMNARHHEHIKAFGRCRTRIRDALTLIDECGVVVLTADASLWRGIREHRWRDVFAARRDEVRRSMAFFVIGHGSCDALRRPFVGLCAKAIAFTVDRIPEATAAQLATADALLADYVVRTAGLTPDVLQPLPLLGVPGVVEDSENPGYYDDIRQFRPVRRRQATRMGPGSPLGNRGVACGIEESPGPAEQDAG